jgi:hypothetical protein
MADPAVEKYATANDLDGLRKALLKKMGNELGSGDLIEKLAESVKDAKDFGGLAKGLKAFTDSQAPVHW